MGWKRMSKRYVYDQYQLGPTIDLSQPHQRTWAENVLGKAVYETLHNVLTCKVKVRVKSINRTTKTIEIEYVDDST